MAVGKVSWCKVERDESDNGNLVLWYSKSNDDYPHPIAESFKAAEEEFLGMAEIFAHRKKIELRK